MKLKDSYPTKNRVLQVTQIENMEMTHFINCIGSKLHLSASNGQWYN